MFCRMCGKQIPNNANNCPYCGEKTAAGVINNATYVQAAKNNTQAPKSVYNNTANSSYVPKYGAAYTEPVKAEKKRGIAGFVIAIVVLSVLLATAIAVIVFMKPWETDDRRSSKDDDDEDVEIHSTIDDEAENTETTVDASDDSDMNISADEAVEDETTPADDAEAENIYEIAEEEAPADTAEGYVSEADAKRAEYLGRCEELEAWSDELWDSAITQHELNSASAEIYLEWDGLLNEVYLYLKDTLPADEFEELKDDELEWIKEKEAAVKAEGEFWEGGSGAPMAMNGVASSYTKERVYYLVSLIK